MGSSNRSKFHRAVIRSLTVPITTPKASAAATAAQFTTATSTSSRTGTEAGSAANFFIELTVNLASPSSPTCVGCCASRPWYPSHAVIPASV